MRHQRKTVKLQRTQGHRNALLSNLVVSLIEHERIKTTVAKAKAVKPLAEKIITLGKKNTLHSRRLALAYLRQNNEAVRKVFSELAPRSADRPGGYTRIIKLGQRLSDSAPMALLEWVDRPVVEAEAAPVEEAKPAKKSTKAAAAVEATETAEAPASEEAAPKKTRSRKKAEPSAEQAGE